MSALAGWDAKDGHARKALQEEHGRVYAWARKYEVVTIRV